MTEAKSLVASKAFWSALLALAAMVAGTFHLTAFAAWAADPATLDTIVQGIGMIGALGAVIFRATATAKITSVLPQMSPVPPGSINAPSPAVIAACALAIMLTACTQAQINVAVDAGARALCDVAQAEAAANAADPRIAAQAAIQGVALACADPAATVAAINAARVALKNALKKRA